MGDALAPALADVPAQQAPSRAAFSSAGVAPGRGTTSQSIGIRRSLQPAPCCSLSIVSCQSVLTLLGARRRRWCQCRPLRVRGADVPTLRRTAGLAPRRRCALTGRPNRVDPPSCRATARPVRPGNGAQTWREACTHVRRRASRRTASPAWSSRPTIPAPGRPSGPGPRCARFLDEAPRQWEVVFVCDGCTDGTPERLAALTRNDYLPGARAQPCAQPGQGLRRPLRPGRGARRLSACSPTSTSPTAGTTCCASPAPSGTGPRWPSPRGRTPRAGSSSRSASRATPTAAISKA